MNRLRIVGAALVLVLANTAVPYFVGYVVPRRTCYGACDDYPFSWWWVLLSFPVVVALAAIAVSLFSASRSEPRQLLVLAAWLTIIVAVVVIAHPDAVRALEPR